MTPQTKDIPDPLGSLTAGEDEAHPPVQEWLDLVESALQGIHHSLNNRIGSLLAVIDLQRSGGLDDVAGGLDGLASEVERLQECNRVIKLLPDTPGGEEALDIRDVLADAMIVHALLPSIKELPVVMTEAAVTPVRAERWALMRALVLLLRSAKSAAKASGAKTPSVHASVDADELRVRVAFRFAEQSASATDGIGAPSPYAKLLAARLGGETKAVPGAVELQMPTLKARRATDRR